jgi:tRNA pseudouridine55 synthase
MEGLLLLNKPAGKTSFAMVSALRRLLKVKTIGHAGTLDPFATGLLLMLIGKKYTQRSNEFLNFDKEYNAQVRLGIETDTYDCTGAQTAYSHESPSLEQLEAALAQFQGQVSQIPPMFSAKKVKGKKLYELARKGIVIERQPVLVQMNIQLLGYSYPHIELKVSCSKGTYIRSLAHDLGKALGCGGHLAALQRTRCGPYHLADSFDGMLLEQSHCLQDLLKALKR